MVWSRPCGCEAGKVADRVLEVLISEADADRVLLVRVGDGEQRALAQLYARYAPVVFSFVLARVVGDAEAVSGVG
jgi:hypothetical protein